MHRVISRGRPEDRRFGATQFGSPRNYIIVVEQTAASILSHATSQALQEYSHSVERKAGSMVCVLNDFGQQGLGPGPAATG